MKWRKSRKTKKNGKFHEKIKKRMKFKIFFSNGFNKFAWKDGNKRHFNNKMGYLDKIFKFGIFFLEIERSRKSRSSVNFIDKMFGNLLRFLIHWE